MVMSAEHAAAINEQVVALEAAVAAEHTPAAEHGEDFLAELGRKLPPSERDFDVFEQVAMHGMSTRAAAGEFQISQTRVRQVVERVQLWILEMTPATASEAVSKQELRMAVALAGDRLDHLYGDSLERWRNSDGIIERVRITRGGDMVTTRSRSHGEPKYLMAAARMAMLRSKLPTDGLITHGMAVAGDVRDAAEAAALEAAAARSEESSAHEDHPVGDCSGRPDVGGQRSEVGGTQERVRPCETTHSKQLNRQQRRARESFCTTAQEEAGSAMGFPGSGAVAQLTLSPNVPGAKLEVRENEPLGETRRHSA